jgi:hypothetical protein
MNEFVLMDEAEAVKIACSRPQPPVFKRRWWFKQTRIDARPVVWSLRHRPEDWETHERDGDRIKHKPSGYTLVLRDGIPNRMWDKTCDDVRYFQSFQKYGLLSAYEDWKKHRGCGTPFTNPDRFAAMFVAPDKT